MSKSLPPLYRKETEKGNRMVADFKRTYRQVNQDNREKDGMDRLHPADYGYGSSQHGGNPNRK